MESLSKNKFFKISSTNFLINMNNEYWIGMLIKQKKAKNFFKNFFYSKLYDKIIDR